MKKYPKFVSVNAKKEKEDKSQNKEDYEMLEEVVIKVRHREDQVYLLQYVLDKDQEVTWLTGSKNSEVFFNSKGQFMVADPEIGLINLETKEVLHEYHLNRTLASEMHLYDLSQGTKLVQSKETKYFLLPNCLLMPYSLLSVVQHY